MGKEIELSEHMGQDKSLWHPSKNFPYVQSDFAAFSHKKVWWQCKLGHEWQAQISNITGGGQCPYCKGKKVLVGFNDLASQDPVIASTWHPTKNIIAPTEVTVSSGKKVWWQCKLDHEWETHIFKRTSGRGCPYCSNQKILKGYNDLETIYPDIAAEWHPTKNKELKPYQLSYGTHKKVWWQCKLGHEWETSVKHRTRLKSKCPFCSNSKTLSGYNDIATTHPELLLQWHPTKNIPLEPTAVSFGSTKQLFWWICEENHTSYALLPDRVRGQQCGICANQVLLQGYNDLATTHPELAKEWHPSKNEGLMATDVISGGLMKVWWKCKKGHEWEARISSRKRDTGCLQCAARNYTSKPELELIKYLNSLNIEVNPNDRKILAARQELDIYIPKKKVAIEFNGLYWHTESQGKDQTYHYNKWLQCKEQNIQLIQIWEDEWNANPELVKLMLAYKLEVSQERKVMARKTAVTIVSKFQAEHFLKANHIQGFSTGSHYVGLKEKGSEELIAVMVLKKEAGTEGKTLNIIRYATSFTVVGGFTKLLAYAENTYNPEKFITFSDNCISDGNLYKNNGFMVDKELAPDYMYVVKGERKHKFGYRLKRFRNDPELQYVEGHTERQLAELNGLERIWDAGKIRWIKEVK